jgi:hypothetical protein
MRRDVYSEIAWNKVDLGVVRVSAASASDAITHAKFVDSFRDRNYFACAAVSESRECIQLCVDFLVCGFYTVLASVLHDLLDEIGPRFDFREKRLGT